MEVASEGPGTGSTRRWQDPGFARALSRGRERGRGGQRTRCAHPPSRTGRIHLLPSAIRRTAKPKPLVARFLQPRWGKDASHGQGKPGSRFYVRSSPPQPVGQALQPATRCCIAPTVPQAAAPTAHSLTGQRAPSSSAAQPIPAGRFPQRWLLRRPPAVTERSKRGRAAEEARAGSSCSEGVRSRCRFSPPGLGTEGGRELVPRDRRAGGALEGLLVGLGWRVPGRLPAVRSGHQSKDPVGAGKVNPGWLTGSRKDGQAGCARMCARPGSAMVLHTSS